MGYMLKGFCFPTTHSKMVNFCPEMRSGWQKMCFFAKIQDGSHMCDLDIPFLVSALRSTLEGCGMKGIEL